MGFVKKLLGMEVDVNEVVKDGKDIVKTLSAKEQGTRRLKIDTTSDTPLSKNVRPIIVLWVLLLFTIMLIGSFFGLDFPTEIKETMFWVLIIAIGFYFPGRTVDKWTKTRLK